MASQDTPAIIMLSNCHLDKTCRTGGQIISDKKEGSNLGSKSERTLESINKSNILIQLLKKVNFTKS